MKKIIVVILILIGKTLAAQELVLTTLDYAKLIPATKKFPEIGQLTIDPKDAQRFLDAAGDKTVKDKITVIIVNLPANTVIKINDEPAVTEGSKTYVDLTKTIQSALDRTNTEKTFSIKIKAGAAAEFDANDFTISWEGFTKTDNIAVSAAAIAQGKANRDKVITAFKRNAAFEKPYDDKKNRVDLYFNENGRLLNHLPVNVDQNDIFYMHIICPKGDEDKYRINITEGEFAASDLAIRPFTKITAGITGSSSNKKETLVPIEYTSTIKEAGPFTTDNFRFQIAYDSSGKEANGLLYNMKINKLYHVGVGVSIISTGLQKPDYKTFFNGTDTTIKAFDSKRRTLFTFNVIWYWSVLHQKRKGSVVPNGRDVLKDEPTFSMTRIFPTVGVSIDNAFKENFFLGAVYEFARGGSLTAGMHYGRVNVLADKNFELEKTKFSGTDADIKMDQAYKTGFYVGLNVDTRILNLLFSKGQ